MRYLVIRTLLLAGATILAGQAPPESCCEMRLIPNAKTPSILTVKVTNVDQPLVVVHETTADMDFVVHVTSGTGHEVERTPFGKRLLTRERSGRMILRELNPGESFSQQLDVGRLFQMASGTDRIIVARDVIVRNARIPIHAVLTIRLP